MVKLENIKLFSLIFIIIFTIQSISGCAPRAKMPKIKVEYYPQCYAPFKELSDYQTKLQRRTIGYTAGGAAAGAGIGALTGLASGDWRGAIAGAIVGAVAGGIAGYNIAKIEEIKDENKRFNAYRDIMAADLVNASDVELSAIRSLKCYVREFEILQRNYAENKITKEEYSKHFKEIREGINELGKITNNTNVLIAERNIEMRASLEKQALAKNKKINNLPTVEQRRIIRNKNNQKIKTSKTKTKKRRGTPPSYELSSSLALSEINSNLDKITKEIESDKIKYVQKDLISVQSSASTNASKPPANFDQIVETYNEYPDKVLQIEDVEQQRKKTLEIMSDAASKTGIDMV